jgi:hypothetical protein
MTATQATKQLLDMGCVFLSIVDIEGNTIVPKQQNKLTTTADIKKQADKINTYLKTAPPGIYVIEGRIGGTSKATQMLINIGNVAPSNGNNSQPTQPMADHAANNVLSYNNALALQKEISDLKAENTRLLLLVQDLEEDIAAMEDAEPQQMADSPAMTALATIAPMAPVVIDQFFKAQRDRLEFEKMKFYEEMKAKESQRQAQYQANGNGEYGSF